MSLRERLIELFPALTKLPESSYVVGGAVRDLLSGRVGHVSDVLHRCTDIPNLAVIFAGNPSANTPELISSGKMANLCKELSARYPDRVIVLDTPPVLASAEPAILASYVHHLVMVVAADQTDRHQLRKSLATVMDTS